MSHVTSPHPANFEYFTSRRGSVARVGQHAFLTRITGYADGVAQLKIVSSDRHARPSHSLLTPEPEASGQACLSWRDGAALRFGITGHRALLTGAPGRCYGVCGAAWILRFQVQGNVRCFGLGEKWGSFEKSGTRTVFYNTDVWAKFDAGAIRAGRCDPLYGSVPYVVIERAGSYFGILVDTAYPVFMQLPRRRAAGAGHRTMELSLGASGGETSVYFLIGPTLSELTRKLQRLVGVTPRPPLWALGHHQSRWGYGSASDLKELDARFERHGLPCDALWLDIDYMRGFRVFTIDSRQLPNPAATLSGLKRRGRRVVAILDPGVKREAGYSVYEEGLKQGHFCMTPQRHPFVGVVWPGDTVFPDFSRTKTRRWWAGHVARFRALGFSAFWLDMNEPACGPVDESAMLFGGGALSHESYHNHYALGMAQASHAGMLRQAPNERVFLLSRAFATSINRYAAVWTGDNYSNEEHLRLSIPTALNLALSGVPFNGPDVPGFGGDATEDLLLRWYKVAFLFPFLRNHACQGTRRQEPWAFSKAALNVVRHYVRLRYKLLPYLYSLFIEQERRGEAILRPLFYDFASRQFGGRAKQRLFEVEDQFMVGPALLQAPVLEQVRGQRRVLLPPGHWLEAHTGRWREGGGFVAARESRESTPLFVREGQLVPMLTGLPRDNHSNLGAIELHVFLRLGTRVRGRLDYEFDDGLSFDYRRGRRSRVSLSARVWRNELRVELHDCEMSYAALELSLVLYARFSRVVVTRAGSRREYTPRPGSWRFTGLPLRVWRTPAFVVQANA